MYFLPYTAVLLDNFKILLNVVQIRHIELTSLAWSIETNVPKINLCSDAADTINNQARLPDCSIDVCMVAVTQLSARCSTWMKLVECSVRQTQSLQCGSVAFPNIQLSSTMPACLRETSDRSETRGNQNRPASSHGS